MEETSRGCTIGGRVLLLFSVLLVAVMPWTEYFYHFDKFPYAGQDFELGMLAVATVVGLILVLLQHGKDGVLFFLAMKRWLSSAMRKSYVLLPDRNSFVVPASYRPPNGHAALVMYNVPIRI